MARMRPHPRLLAVRVMLTVELCKQQQHYNKNNIFPIALCILFFTRSGCTHFSLFHEKKIITNLNNSRVVVVIINIYFLLLRWAATTVKNIYYLILFILHAPHATRRIFYILFRSTHVRIYDTAVEHQCCFVDIFRYLTRVLPPSENSITFTS